MTPVSVEPISESRLAEIRKRTAWHQEARELGLINFSVREVASLLALLDQKERERVEARADLDRLMDPELKHLRIEGGAIDVALTGPIVQHMGLVISEHFRASGAENYIEMTYHAKTEPFETYVWTIQKRVGSNSPHDLRAKAEARATAAEADKAELRRALECVKQQCETAVYNIRQREHDEAVVRSFQSVADFACRAALSATSQDRGNREGEGE
ncbi:hypothetical protein [Bosea sp. BK604]|uniref:hypothetical protein n=1 Tax=Bosea sp. BK604 TaxID=2512180 RepID=UPI0010430B7B|nr:hypothetical protein [Bosea sp. BK604]TCR64653.1 hypothetical protein EV560_106118 [Bosea sp. BK604]